MKMPSAIAKRSIVRILHGGTSRRAVVLECSSEGALLIIAGTRTKRAHYPHVAVEGQEAAKCGFPETTYFYTADILDCRIADCQKVEGQFLYPRFLALRQLAAARVRAFLRAQAVAGAERLASQADDAPDDQRR
jgi:hypothetical protein